MAKYGEKASKKVQRALHKAKRGTLRSGGSGRKVKSRKQAIAIGLSEARREGGKVPGNPSEGSSAGKKSRTRKTAKRKTAKRKTAKRKAKRKTKKKRATK